MGRVVISEAKNSSGNLLVGLLKSPLARQVLLIFLVLPLLEAVFIGVLCQDINGTQEDANREFEGVKISQEFNAALDFIRQSYQDLRAVNKIISRQIANDASPIYKPGYMESNPAIQQGLANFWHDQPMFITWSRKGISGLRKIAPKAEEHIAGVENVIYELADLSGKTAKAQPYAWPTCYEKFVGTLHLAYYPFLNAIKAANLSTEEATKFKPIFGIDPQTVLYIAGAFNLVYIILLGLFIEFRITRPVVSLAKNCEKLKTGDLIEKPKKVSNEIDSLQNSFSEMSQRISENKKRRSSYLELLQTVQTAALVKVNGWLETVLNFKPPEQPKKRVEKSKTNITSLIGILQSMTDALADDGVSKITVQMRKCNSGKLCADANSAVESLLEQRKIKLKVEAEDFQLHADPMLLGRVLLNLLSNAVKYSPEGGEIIFAVSRDGDTVRFSVKDNGPGINDEGKSKLFKRFSMLKSLDGVKRAGTGLGLVICKDIVEAHGGEIHCDSEPGKGSTFWFEIPISPAAQMAKVSAQADTSKKATQKKKGSLKIQFAAVIIAFIAVQGIIFFELSSAFAESAKYAKVFSNERAMVLDSEAAYGVFLLSGRAGDERDFEKASHLLAQEMQMIEGLQIRAKDNAGAYAEFTEIYKRLKVLHRMLLWAQANPDKLMSAGPELIQRCRRLMDEGEDTFFRIFRMQRASFKSSYEGGQQVMAKMLSILGIAAVADLIVLAAAAFVTLMIIRKLKLLEIKAEDFAVNKPISPSISGNDELTLLDERLCEASNSIQEAESQRQELMAVINHDLRTPLTSILGNLQMLSQGVYGPLPAEPAQVVGRSEEQVQDLLRQINDLLMLEKIDSGTYQLATEKLDFAEILKESLSSIQSANKKNVAVSVDDASISNIAISGDKQLLVRLCSIVLANAVAVSPSQGQVRLSVKQSNGSLVAEIEDRGPGIAPELQKQIFNRFRFVNGKPLTGLGLPLAYRLCQMHSGNIQLDSGRQGGTRVEISLPVAH